MNTQVEVVAIERKETAPRANGTASSLEGESVMQRLEARNVQRANGKAMRYHGQRTGRQPPCDPDGSSESSRAQGAQLIISKMLCKVAWNNSMVGRRCGRARESAARASSMGRAQGMGDGRESIALLGQPQAECQIINIATLTPVSGL